MLLRRERPDDHSASDAVHRLAFPDPAPGVEPVEVGLVRALRLDVGFVPQLSWVAEDAGEVIGHVICTEGSIGDIAVPGLGPIGVVPDHQGGGAGRALMWSVIAAADALGYPAVVLLGDPGYYSRFGFTAATALGIEPPDAAWAGYFQALGLDSHTADLRGRFRYAAPFDAL